MPTASTAGYSREQGLGGSRGALHGTLCLGALSPVESLGVDQWFMGLGVEVPTVLKLTEVDAVPQYLRQGGMAPLPAPGGRRDVFVEQRPCDLSKRFALSFHLKDHLYDFVVPVRH